MCDNKSSNSLHKYNSPIGRCEAGSELLYVLCCTLLELLDAELLYVKAYLCARLEDSRVTTCTRTDTHCANGLAIMRQLLSTDACAVRPGGAMLVEGRIGVCLSAAQRIGFFFFTWSLYNLSFTGFLPWRPRFGARLVHVRFLVYEVTNRINFALPGIVIPPKFQSSIVCRSLFACLSCELAHPHAWRRKSA